MGETFIMRTITSREYLKIAPSYYLVVPSYEEALFFCKFVFSSMQMSDFQDNATFLNLFSQEKGLKFLTHEFEPGFDFVKYLYRCQRLIASKQANLFIKESIFELVKGFLLGPKWVDYKGDPHTFFISSEESLTYFENTGQHPLNNKVFEEEIKAFRKSIRFRSGLLDLFLREMEQKYEPVLKIIIPENMKGADMYVETRAIRSVIDLILNSMAEYSTHPRIVFSYFEEPIEDKRIKSTLSVTQVGSFPKHSLQRDMSRLSQGDGGTFGTIRRQLQGLCE